MTKRGYIIISVLLLALLSLFSFCWRLRHPVFLPIKEVRIVALYQKVDRASLKDVIFPYVSSGFLNVDSEAIKQHLLSLPWVEDVSVRRLWPDTVDVGVIEQRAIARWNDNGLVNRKGAVFSPDIASYPTNLPILHGPEGQAYLMLQYYQKMSQLLKPFGLTITEIDLSSRRAWNVVLNNNFTVLLGRMEIIPRLLRFATVYLQKLQEHAAQLAYVDVRYHNGLAVSWKPQPLSSGVVKKN